MAEFGWGDTSLLNCGLHGSDKPQPCGFIRNAFSVAAGTGAQNFGVNVGTTANRVLVAFDDERSGTFADYGTITFEVERTTGPSRVVGTSRQAFEAVKLGDINRVNVRTAGTDDHRVGSPGFNNPNGF